MSTSLVFAYKANAMITVDEDVAMSIEWDVYLGVAIGDHVLIVIMQFTERARPWSSEGLEDVPKYIPWMVESVRGVLLTLSRRVIDRVRRVGLRRVVSGTRHFPVSVLAAILCSYGINWDFLDVVGWYPYDITSEDMTLCRRDAVSKGGGAQDWCQIPKWG